MGPQLRIEAVLASDAWVDVKYVMRRGPARKYRRAEVVDERDKASVCGMRKSWRLWMLGRCVPQHLLQFTVSAGFIFTINKKGIRVAIHAVDDDDALNAAGVVLGKGFAN